MDNGGEPDCQPALHTPEVQVTASERELAQWPGLPPPWLGAPSEAGGLSPETVPKCVCYDQARSRRAKVPRGCSRACHLLPLSRPQSTSEVTHSQPQILKAAKRAGQVGEAAGDCCREVLTGGAHWVWAAGWARPGGEPCTLPHLPTSADPQGTPGST